MSDFDDALERLLADPNFAMSLASDPSAALAGYHLSAEELELLSAQVSRDAGGDRTVEPRTNQSSTFGLFAPLLGGSGIGGLIHGTTEGGSGAGDLVTGMAGGAGADGVPAGGGTAGGVPAGGGTAGFGAAEDISGFGAAPREDAALGMGAAPADGTAPEGGTAPGGDTAPDVGGLSSAFDGDLGRTIGDGVAEPDGNQGFGAADLPDQPRGPGERPVPGYQTRVDVDGDGRWDAHWYAQRDDSGVDIVADMNNDGRADFVGHDFDRDGLVDAADYDKNRDGRFETHMLDADGDGWLDRTVISPEPTDDDPSQHNG